MPLLQSFLSAVHVDTSVHHLLHVLSSTLFDGVLQHEPLENCSFHFFYGGCNESDPRERRGVPLIILIRHMTTKTLIAFNSIQSETQA